MRQGRSDTMRRFSFNALKRHFGITAARCHRYLSCDVSAAEGWSFLRVSSPFPSNLHLCLRHPNLGSPLPVRHSLATPQPNLSTVLAKKSNYSPNNIGTNITIISSISTLNCSMNARNPRQQSFKIIARSKSYESPGSDIRKEGKSIVSIKIAAKTLAALALSPTTRNQKKIHVESGAAFQGKLIEFVQSPQTSFTNRFTMI